MERIERILANAEFISVQQRLDVLEQERIYCRHGMDHSLDVARITYIQCLEKGISIDKDLIYATALLHDLGRVAEYELGEPHHLASVQLAKRILKKCEFEEKEIAIITEAIGEHRNQQSSQSFATIFYQADKLSRNCFCCKAADTCKWDIKKRNTHITC